MRLAKSIVVIILLTAGLLLASSPTYALTYGLVPPEGELAVDQEIAFIITIDTEGESLTTATVGMTYQTNFMQYLNTVPGNTFGAVNATETTKGTLIFTATSTAGYKGSGDFAVVNFRILASASASEVCALFIPETPAPTQAPQPTSPPAATSAPAPTAIPQSGSFGPIDLAGALGAGIFLIASGSYLLKRKSHG